MTRHDPIERLARTVDLDVLAASAAHYRTPGLIALIGERAADEGATIYARAAIRRRRYAREGVIRAPAPVTDAWAAAAAVLDAYL